MRQGTVLALVAAAAFVAVGVATLPASLLVSRLPADLTADGVGGSVWNGGADAIRLRGTPLGALSWAIDAGALLGGELAYHIEVTRPDGYVRGRIAAHLGGALDGRDIELSLPLTTLNPAQAHNAWRGTLAGTVAAVRLEHGWPVALAGSFRMDRLQAPGSDLDLGAFGLEFDAPATSATQVVGRVRDLAALLMVRAQLVIKPDRSYVLSGEVTPRPESPPEVSQSIAFLGAPDASGRRSFEITGTF